VICKRAVLGSYFLKENLNTVGRVGCANCLLGSVLLVLHAPADREIQSIDEVLDLATKPCKYFPLTGEDNKEEKEKKEAEGR
jgi:Magnesium transporter NIPA